eukprot:7391471-Prymnesium_polylepis.4
MASNSESPAAKRRKTDSEPPTKLLKVNYKSEEGLNRTRYVDWDLRKSFADFQADPQIGICEGVECFTGLSLVVNQHAYDQLMSGDDSTVELYLRASADREVEEPATMQRQQQQHVQLVMREDVAMLKKQNEATLKQYPTDISPVKLGLSVGNESGTLLLRWSEVGLYNGTGVRDLVNGTALKGSVLGAETESLEKGLEDGEIAELPDLAAATVLCALQRAMGKSKPMFELELFAGEQGELPELHQRLVPHAGVIAVKLNDDHQELLLVPVSAYPDGPRDELQLFLGYLATPDALKTEYEQLLNKKIPVVLVSRPGPTRSRPDATLSAPRASLSRVHVAGIYRTSTARSGASQRTSMLSNRIMTATKTTGR